MSSGEVRLRDFRDSDVADVRRLIEQTIDACYTGVYPPRAVRFFKDFHTEEAILERHREGRMLVLESAGEPIATGSIVGADILGVFVRPDRQHQGHGAVVMRELERTGRARGLDALTLSVSLPSRGFYEHLGYRIVEECAIDVGEGQRLEYWEARKALEAGVPDGGS